MVLAFGILLAHPSLAVMLLFGILKALPNYAKWVVGEVAAQTGAEIWAMVPGFEGNSDDPVSIEGAPSIFDSCPILPQIPPCTCDGGHPSAHNLTVIQEGPSKEHLGYLVVVVAAFSGTVGAMLSSFATAYG